MTKEVLSALGAAARRLPRDWRALAALAVLYAALIAACGLFVTTGVATAWQLALSAAAFALAPLLLFVLLCACALYAAGERRMIPLVAGALRGFWKTVLFGLPVLALVVLAVWGTDKLETKVRHDPRAEAAETFSTPDDESAEDSSGESAATRQRRPVRWKYVFFSAARLLLLGVVLPLAALHLFIAAARAPFGASLRGAGRTLARAYGPRPVLTYAVGMILFALLPYFLVNVRTPTDTGWLEVALLTLRLALAFLLTLGGVLITMTALAAFSGDGGELLPATPAPTPPPPSTRADEPARAGA